MCLVEGVEQDPALAVTGAGADAKYSSGKPVHSVTRAAGGTVGARARGPAVGYYRCKINYSVIGIPSLVRATLRRVHRLHARGHVSYRSGANVPLYRFWDGRVAVMQRPRSPGRVVAAKLRVGATAEH